MSFETDMLALVEQQLLARAAGDFVSQYSLGGVSLSTWSTEQLVEYRDKLKKDISSAASSSGSRFHFANLRPGG